MINENSISTKIYSIRGSKVMIDRDLASLYGVETRVMNQAVRRNIKRFPEDFMFQLSPEEFNKWKYWCPVKIHLDWENTYKC
ncbi:MAG: ORF6N domain-containing protein [Bacteroidales bacterium]|nr:ORF6N domain-containing protein [Bacteroidales bacterium]